MVVILSHVTLYWLKTNLWNDSVFIQYGRTPLHLAANNGSLEVVRHLCLHGANIDAVTNVSHTQLSSFHCFLSLFSRSSLTLLTLQCSESISQALKATQKNVAISVKLSRAFCILINVLFYTWTLLLWIELNTSVCREHLPRWQTVLHLLRDVTIAHWTRWHVSHTSLSTIN